MVVFEAIDERADLSAAAARAGIEILTETDHDFDPDPDFPRTTGDQDLPVGGCLHAVCVNEQAKANILRQWRNWQQTGRVDHGYAPLRVLFEHLKDVRAWGLADRVRLDGVAEALEGMLPGVHPVEIELWFRKRDTDRQQAEAEVTALVTRGGGQVVSVAQVPEVGYHGMKCTVPLELLQRLAAGDYDAVDVVKSSAVMYLRVTAQSHSIFPADPDPTTPSAPLPTGDPVLCILDGYPVANHPLLAGRIQILDPDDLGEDTTTAVELRAHGTAMASVAVWGDLNSPDGAATRPVVVRPILTPAQDTSNNQEELPTTELAPDLMRRVFRELFGDSSTPGAAPSVVVVNLSVGDPAAKFDGVLSSWARTIDWLSAEYGVVVVVSAGNHTRLQIPQGVQALSSLSGPDRATAIVSVVSETAPRRSLLAPADAVNALTVGALNDDGAGDVALGTYQFDPADGELIVNPMSALGSGHHRSIKPELTAPGGRARFQLPMTAADTVLRHAPYERMGPGIKVAAPTGGEAFILGTSPAAAEISRAAARAVDTVLARADRDLTRSELAVATKAMVAHGAQVPPGLVVHEKLSHESHGYGTLTRHLADGCDPHEATILYVGGIGENESRTLYFPLPDGLQTRGLKRITATLAWMSPVNWSHRQYRRAALEFAKPTGFTELGTAVGALGDKPKRGTLQHVQWQPHGSVPFGQGSDLELTIKCKGQAGGLQGQRVNFGVVLSLWVAPELNVDVYTQVRQQVETRLTIRPPGAA